MSLLSPPPARGPAADFSIAVVDLDPEVREQLHGALGDPAAVRLASVEELEDALPVGRPAVAVLGPSSGDPIGLTAVERLTRLRPEVAAVLVVDQLTTEVLQRALRAGVRDVLPSPVDAEQLATAVARVAAVALPAIPAPSARPERDDKVGRVITVFSTKGGAGKSVLAVNLAVALARKTGEQVALVDADLQFGDLAVMLKLAPQHTIVDAVNSIDRLDSQLLGQLLVRHEPTGIAVLPAPLEPAFADQIGASQMNRIIGLLRSSFAYVVVDTPAYFNEVVLGLIEESDDVLLVAGMDIPNIKNVKIGLQTLRLLNISMVKLKLVLNRANSKVKLEVGDVEKTLGVKADCLVPSDIVVPQSVNKGIPVVLDAPKSGVARAIEQLAAEFVPVDETSAPTKRRLRR